ncbi:hypothetical protein [Alkalihalobacterium alkalinitrilicum]|nr:hypothetical protein [Alkalihalobacterium alkalinitrilicum]
MRQKKIGQPLKKSELHAMEKTFLRWVSLKRLEEDLQNRSKESH